VGRYTSTNGKRRGGEKLLSIKEMPLEDKYNNLLDDYLLSLATDYILLEEQGVVDKSIEMIVSREKKRLPNFLGIAAYNVLKAISPGRAFKQVVEQFVYGMQNILPLSSMGLTYVSDREAIVSTENCPLLKRTNELVSQTDLDVDPKFLCKYHTGQIPDLVKEFGIDVTTKLKETGCAFTAKLL